MMLAKAQAVISSDPEILGGSPVFAGTRVPIDTLIAHLKAGETIDTFIEDFPTVSRDQVNAYLDLAASLTIENGGNAHSSR
jgi:uncharacterized protein (DUF433 family)